MSTTHSSGHTNLNSSQSQNTAPRRGVHGFLDTFQKHCVWILSFSFVLVFPPYAYMAMKAQVYDNAFSAYLPFVVEAYAEAGDDYDAAKKDHARVLRVYVDSLERTDFGMLLGALSPRYSPSSRLDPVIEQLKATQDGRTTIREAADTVYKLYQDSVERDVKSRGIVAVSPRVTNDFLLWVDTTIELSCDSVNEFESLAKQSLAEHEGISLEQLEQLVKASERACRYGRGGWLFLLFAWDSYTTSDRADLIVQFQESQERSSKITFELSRKLAASHQQEKSDTVAHWAASMKRRADSVQALQTRNKGELQRILLGYVEEARRQKDNRSGSIDSASPDVYEKGSPPQP